MFKKSISIGMAEYTGLAPTEIGELCMRRVPPGAVFMATYLDPDKKGLRVDYLPYQAGDIAGILGGAGSQITSRIFEPKTRLYHFLIIGEYIPEEDDYLIYEALASGVRTGRLIWYAEDLYVVFRLNDLQARALGRKAAREASAFGRWGYDYVMYLYIVLDLARIFARMILKERHLRRVKPSELPYRENHAFICTEFANAVYRSGGRAPIPKGVTPLPAGYIDAFKAGRLMLVGSNIPQKYQGTVYTKEILPKFKIGGKIDAVL